MKTVDERVNIGMSRLVFKFQYENMEVVWTKRDNIILNQHHFVENKRETTQHV
jgi:hypothetical protein